MAARAKHQEARHREGRARSETVPVGRHSTSAAALVGAARIGAIRCVGRAPLPHDFAEVSIEAVSAAWRARAQSNPRNHRYTPMAVTTRPPEGPFF